MKYRYLLPSVIIIGSISLVVIAILLVKGVQQPQQAVPSHAETTTTTDVTKCQGNSQASAKCFKCSDRNTPGQVNILDFSCFAKWYGQNVGKP